MKKFFGILTVVLCICFVLAMPVSAAGDPMAEKFQEELGLLDHFYDYDYHYILLLNVYIGKGRLQLCLA